VKLRFFSSLTLLIFVLVSSLLAVTPNFPNYVGYVNDFAGVIDADTEAKLTALCQGLEKANSAEMAIVTVPTVAPLDSKTYTTELFQKWGIGKKGKDNGILVLLAMAEKRIEIEPGYGLEGIINDAKAGRILDQYALPSFKRGDFARGLWLTAQALANEIKREPNPALEETVTSLQTIFGWVFVGVIIVIITMFALFFLGFSTQIIGALVGGVVGFVAWGIAGAVIGAVIGFMISLGKSGPGSMTGRTFGGWTGGSFGGGGFGGFGGGRSGGGGAGRGF